MEVQCDCGSPKTERKLASLKFGATKSCGCLKREVVSARNKSTGVEISLGAVYGRLQVREVISGERGRVAVCLCSCGNERNVSVNSLLSGATKSCGCLRRELTASKNTSHGQSKTKLYNVWKAIKERCTVESSKAYKHYGGRGITVCSRWLDFANFEADMGQPPFEGATIDRKDNDKGYCPENCRWATHAEQSRNTRRNTNFEWKGQTLCLKDIAKLEKVPYGYLYYRVHKMQETPQKAVADKLSEQGRLNETKT